MKLKQYSGKPKFNGILMAFAACGFKKNSSYMSMSSTSHTLRMFCCGRRKKKKCQRNRQCGCRELIPIQEPHEVGSVLGIVWRSIWILCLTVSNKWKQKLNFNGFSNFDLVWFIVKLGFSSTENSFGLVKGLAEFTAMNYFQLENS